MHMPEMRLHDLIGSDMIYFMEILARQFDSQICSRAERFQQFLKLGRDLSRLVMQALHSVFSSYFSRRFLGGW